MKIYVVGSSRDKFLPLDNIREKYLIDQKHEGNNIDFLNPWYCELTGLYYLWKNVEDDIVGLEHYRAYFWKNGHRLTEKEINEELKKGDVICGGYKYPFAGNQILETELNRCTHRKTGEFIKSLEKNDKNFADYFRKFLRGQRLWACNLFVGPKKIFDEWMEFFFDVIIDFEQRNPVGPATNTWRREGYFSEFAFGAWLEYKGYKIVQCDINKFSKDFRRTDQYMAGPTKRINQK